MPCRHPTVSSTGTLTYCSQRAVFASLWALFSLFVVLSLCLQYPDTVYWAPGRACSLWRTDCWHVLGADVTGALHARLTVHCCQHCHLLHLLLQQKSGWFDALVPAYLGCPGNWPLGRACMLLLLVWWSLTLNVSRELYVMFLLYIYYISTFISVVHYAAIALMGQFNMLGFVPLSICRRLFAVVMESTVMCCVSCLLGLAVECATTRPSVCSLA